MELIMPVMEISMKVVAVVVCYPKAPAAKNITNANQEFAVAGAETRYASNIA